MTLFLEGVDNQGLLLFLPSRTIHLFFGNDVDRLGCEHEHNGHVLLTKFGTMGRKQFGKGGRNCHLVHRGGHVNLDNQDAVLLDFVNIDNRHLIGGQLNFGTQFFLGLRSRHCDFFFVTHK